MSNQPLNRSDLTPGRPTADAPSSRQFSAVETLASRPRGRDVLSLVREIRDYNADASAAISNVLRLANSGWSVTAYGPDGQSPDPTNQAIIDEFLDPLAGRLAREYGGGLDVLLDQIHLTLATQGGIGLEIELNETATEVADVIAVNPWLVSFEKDAQGRWVPGVSSLGDFYPLNPLQFRYKPVDPEPGDPRGRSPFWAALDVVFFQMEVLRDLKAAVHFAGYPRIDISVAWDAVLQNVRDTRPDLLEPGRADDLRSWLDSYLGDITDYLDTLNPDDAFVHFDSVSSQFITPGRSAVDVSQLTAAIDAQIVSGLKQLPILLGRNEGATTTHASVQWQVFAQELKSYQRKSAQLIAWALSFALRVAGRLGRVELEYEPIKTSDRLADAQAAEIETRTLIYQREAGWITNDEAAQAAVGHDSVAEPPASSGNPDNPDNVDTVNANATSVAPALGRPSHLHGEHGEHDHRVTVATRQDLELLPPWQQARYQRLETLGWQAYQDQIRRAWDTMQTTLESGDAPDPDPEPQRLAPAPTPVMVSTNGHNKARDAR